MPPAWLGLTTWPAVPQRRPQHLSQRPQCRGRDPAPMNVVNAILIKLVSVLLFAVMSVLVRWLGDRVPLGQVLFFRSAFAILPVLLFYSWRGELMAAVRTDRPFGHAGRGLISVASMFLNFAALARLAPPRADSA